jgi:CheY-like chemotaxis protein
MSEGLLRFRVSDTGEGIAPVAIERIFDAFEQGPSTTAPARSGAGLGLTISRQLARAMGGDVVCRSVPGQGTTFEFTIQFRPTTKMPTPRQSLTEELAAAGETTPPAVPPRPGRVLVVEDNEVNALVVRGMLEQMGVHAELAVDGAQALARMGEKAYDLVLMDCQMQVLDGWEATRTWRAREARLRQHARVPIVALTASAAAGERERCLDAGMDDYLSKPFTREALGRLVDRYLAR